ncbi:MAG: TonB-dependent receptor [Rudaea sp.]|uniref:TonB-dependent receptor n=1 Tax=unclassified Rudaea TaxID=2627037 RepID=UPI0010F9B48B|nr:MULTISPECIES: TonB-dependent receptor [unclassified Rudaea]MBN8884504.1 TonB-dependent receptor [Rudaea sp.]MBR0345280.1 TonB-dependent receptor [Rudaea sp.]
MVKRKLALMFSAALLFGVDVAVFGNLHAAAEAEQGYRIPAGDLDSALNALATQSHLQIVYAPELVAGKKSAGLSGSYAPARALSRLLEGSGLNAEAINAGTYVIKSAAKTAEPKPVAAPPAPAAEPAAEKPADLSAVVVTGSLIPRAQIETASPTIRITADEMKRQGFNTVYDALKALPISTGAVQGPQGASTYTTAAQALSLYGLDPGFTLVMIDGHPLPDYPLLYDGASNFSDLSGIPVAMVDRIDIVPGNQSAVYGSSAIAGVVNIILKKRVEGVHLTLRGGTYSQGGGNSQRIELVGGYGGFEDRLHLIYGFQYSNQQPIWAYDRALTRSTASNPTTPTPVAIQTFMHGETDANGATQYVAPPAGACDKLGGLFNGSTYLAHARAGDYCGSNAAGYRTMMNQQRQYVGYLSGTFKINDGAELYGTALYSLGQYEFAPLGGFIWLPNIAGYGQFHDAGTGKNATAWRQFSPEEQNYSQSVDRQVLHSYQTVLGMRGNIAGSDWTYDAYLDRAEQTIKDRQLYPLKAKIDAFFEKQFLGPQQGIDPNSGYPIYTPDWAKFYQPITPADYRSFSDYKQTNSSSLIEHGTLQIGNTNLFALPAGNVSLAAQLQGGHQTWSNPTDPRIVAGDFWGLAGTVGAGTRSNYAGALEINMPITSMLTADAAVRYDEYRYAGRSDGKVTWRASLEFRPFEGLLLRGNYGTAFRAPDMGRTFLGSSGTFLAVTDYYLCDKREPGVPLADCTYNNVNLAGVHAGNRDLKDITAKSRGIGAVWSPTSNFNLHADYLHIAIANEITDLNVDQLMRDEAQCQKGALDKNSPTCRDVAARVERDGLGNLQLITFGPINVSTEKLSTLSLGGSYRIETERLGNFTLGLEYNNVLNHTRVQYVGDPQLDLLHDPTQSREFKTILNGNINWTIGDWSATAYAIRYGKTPNYTATRFGYSAPGAGTLAPWTLYNLSVGYRLLSNARLTFVANNVFDKAPPFDRTYSRWPYYSGNSYNIYGRAYFLELNWDFGVDTR